VADKRDQRTERLLALLRARGDGVTVPELAQELGVSERTVFRDIATLRERGVEVEGEPGRGGGVRAAARGPLPPIRLALDEGVSLWLALGLAQATAGLPFARGARAAMDKVLAALPPDRRRSLKRLCERVVVAGPASERVAQSAGDVSPSVLDATERAFFGRSGLAFAYVDRAGQRTQRRVEPHGLLVQHPVWYVVAWDLDKEAGRLFRMDRISRPRVLEHVRFSPRADKLVRELAAEAL
jgi:predicted DNA-binding transcriptional regulator YafY